MSAMCWRVATRPRNFASSSRPNIANGKTLPGASAFSPNDGPTIVMTNTQGGPDLTLGSAPLSMRPTLAGLEYMISAGHYLATQAGARMLEAGGNAVDAGCAAGIALGVVQSDIVNVAGVAPILVRMADSGEVISIAGLGWWPAALDPAEFLQRHGGQLPVGVLRTVVPAAPDAWLTALAKFGTMRFGEIAEPAIRYAREGFHMHPLTAQTLVETVEDYGRWDSTRAIYLPGGKPPAVGDLFLQTDLAATLQYMADEERAAGGDLQAGY